ncbi:MAG: AraC family transcriptional regulator [Acetobacteraceae bacterium]
MALWRNAAGSSLRTRTPHETIDGWSSALGMSRRAFTRLFRRETGLSFVAWRQQACLFAALPRLFAGEPVTAVAIELGYDNPAAFTTMFKRLLGAPPRRYLQQSGEETR